MPGWQGRPLGLPAAAVLLLLLNAAWGAPAPLEQLLKGNGNAAVTAGQAPSAAAAAAAGRRSLQAGRKKPLPNFEIGVPAPPRKVFRQWQQAAVRERVQEFGSASFVAPGHPPLGYVAICVVARDAHADLLEWVNHHLRLGVSKIYLWDHASDPPMESVVKGFISAGIVQYQHFTSVPHPSGKPQLYAYDQCLQQHGARHTWMGFIDVDEFLMFRDPWPSVQSLPRFLSEFAGPGAPPNANSGVGVHWLIFGSSGHASRPPSGVLRSYHRCLQLWHAQHCLVKTIVRTACTVAAEGPHSFKHNCTQPVLQTDRTPIHGARSDVPVHKRLALHHYATKSRDEFALKMVRGSAMKRQRGWEYFAFIDEWSTEFNFDGQMLWDTVASFQHYPAVTKQHLERYQHEQHEDFWLKGADDPRYQEQLRQQQEQERRERVQAAAAAVATAAQQQAQQAAVAQQADVAVVQQQAAVAQQADVAVVQQQAAAAQQQAQQQAAVQAGGLQSVAAQQEVDAAASQAASLQQQHQQQQQQAAAAQAQQLHSQQADAAAAAAAAAGQQTAAAATQQQQQQQQQAAVQQQAVAAAALAQQQGAGAATALQR
ncbi:hypothetical protein ABPG75_004698 [Micractinium tetrahymenae]